ncbi:hypothetical protein EPN96_06645 [bacterium]|nr:MAG: hypothetical protein EPN96_06645 [bacterium]
MTDGYAANLTFGTDLLSGLGEVRDNNDARKTKKAYEKRATYIGGLLSSIKPPLLKNLAPGGFLREVLAGDRMERAALDSADALVKARRASSRTSGSSRAGLVGARIGEILGREGGRGDAEMKADSMLADGALSTLGGAVTSVRTNPFYDYANGVRTFGNDLPAMIIEWSKKDG